MLHLKPSYIGFNHAKSLNLFAKPLPGLSFSKIYY